MLNELHDLARSLKAVQVSMASWHQHFKSCPKGTATYYLLLDSLGQATDLEPVADRERIAAIRKWEVAAGVSFPAFNVLPLFEPKSDTDKKLAVDLRKSITAKSPPTSEEIKQRIELVLSLSKSLWVAKEPARINKCLTTLPSEVAKSLGTLPDEVRSIGDVISRASKVTAETLHARLAEILVDKILQSPSEASGWFDALFFHSGKVAKKLSLIAELSDRSAYAYPANHERVQTWMNSRFQDAESTETSIRSPAQREAEDAFAMPAIRVDESFPAVRLPVLGNVILRSMSSESPCQRRYGVADAESCPVGQVTRQDMKNALEWIGDSDRREKTWCDVSALSGKSTVLFAYPSAKVQVAPEIAGLIVGFDADADPDGAKFEACAARVATSLTALAHEAPAPEVRVFVLAKPDGFRTKVLHSSRYSVERLLQSAEEWKVGCRNLPSLKVRRFGESKGDKPVWADPFIPYPAEVVSCLNTVWERAGTHAEQVPGFGIGDGLGLLLERGPVLQSIAMRAVRSLIANSLNLVLALSSVRHQGEKELKKQRPLTLTDKRASLLPRILGLLLAKLGRWKGDYMKGPPYLVGRLLSLADQLHVEYCLGERKGQIASQLIGSALMPTALEQPQKALALLCQRMPPYKNWATRLQEGERIGLTKYLLGELGRVCSQLKNEDLPPTCNDADKAEMLLGYLAWPEKEETLKPANEGTSA